MSDHILRSGRFDSSIGYAFHRAAWPWLWALAMAGVGCQAPPESGDTPTSGGGGAASDAPSVSRTVPAPSLPSSVEFDRSGVTERPDTPQLPNVPLVAGWTNAGNVALFMPQTGEIVSEKPAAGLAGERDIAFDPWQKRVFVLESDLDDAWGEISLFPLLENASKKVLGAPEHKVFFDGVAGISVSPFGVVVTEENIGARWRLVGNDGAFSPSAPAPRPASLAGEFLPNGEFRLTALTYGFSGDVGEMYVAPVTAQGIGQTVPIATNAQFVSNPLTARWVHTADGGHLIDLSGVDPVLSTPAGSGYPPWVPIVTGLEIESISQAATFPSKTKVALLTVGSADLVVFGIGANGGPECSAGIDLPGVAFSRSGFFSRGVLPVSEAQVLVATSEGVFLVGMSTDCPPVLTIDSGFQGSDLQGPIDGVF